MTDVSVSAFGLADSLKDATREVHARAERHPFQASILTGRAGLDGFLSLRAQLMTLHEGFEASLTDAARRDGRLAQLVRPYHYRAALLRKDLETLHVHPWVDSPLPVVADFLAPLANRVVGDPPWFVGVLYTLEGSTNGGRFIAAALRKSLKLTTGLTHLEPHGEAQQSRWAEFRAGLNALSLDPRERERVQAGAADMFGFMIALFDGLSAKKVGNVPIV